MHLRKYLLVSFKIVKNNVKPGVFRINLSYLHKTVWYEVGLKLVYIGTNNIREDELNPRLQFTMVILYLFQNTYAYAKGVA